MTGEQQVSSSGRHKLLIRNKTSLFSAIDMNSLFAQGRMRQHAPGEKMVNFMFNSLHKYKFLVNDI